MTGDCDLCGEETPPIEGRYLSLVPFLDKRDRAFRLAWVCEDCIDERLLPSLRLLFRDGAHNLSEPSPDAGRHETEKPTGVLFRTFDIGGATHIASKVYSGPAYGHRFYCEAACGVSGFAVPEAEQRPLPEPREGIVCGRCARFEPLFVEDPP